MGRKMDALLGRNFKTSKLKTVIKLAVSRLSLLKNHRHAIFNVARCDTIQLIRLNHHQQALLRVEQVIKDQNMLDVYDMIDGYCHLLKQRMNIIEQANDCPEELKEAASSLVYAAPRCGEFPELQEIRAILTTYFGKEFAYDSINLRSNCGVGQTMIQKLSPKESSYEFRMKMLTRIAKENGIVLQVEKFTPEIIKEKLIIEKKPSQLNTQIEKVLNLSESMKERRNYKDDVTEENEGERSKTNMKDEEFGDLYSENYSDDENYEKKIVFHENEKTGLPSRNAYFSSYKQFPFGPQVNANTGLA